MLLIRLFHCADCCVFFSTQKRSLPANRYCPNCREKWRRTIERQELGTNYVKKLMRTNPQYKTAKIPLGLIEAKRLQVCIKRQIKENKKKY